MCLMSLVKARAKALHMSQTKYIRTAIEHMNEEVLLRESQQKLRQASLRVRKESQLVNAEFSRIEHDPKDLSGIGYSAGRCNFLLLSL
jgi:hypothetical protein